MSVLSHWYFCCRTVFRLHRCSCCYSTFCWSWVDSANHSHPKKKRLRSTISFCGWSFFSLHILFYSGRRRKWNHKIFVLLNLLKGNAFTNFYMFVAAEMSNQHQINSVEWSSLSAFTSSDDFSCAISALCCRASRLICHSCPDSCQCSTLGMWPLQSIMAMFRTDNGAREIDQLLLLLQTQTS